MCVHHGTRRSNHFLQLRYIFYSYGFPPAVILALNYNCVCFLWVYFQFNEVTFSVSALICTVVEKRLDAFSHQPQSDQTEAPTEEPRSTDATPQVAGETDTADQPVAEKEETDQPVAEEQPSRRISSQLEESDQAGTEDLETEKQAGKSSSRWR